MFSSSSAKSQYQINHLEEVSIC